ncbi:hypothetical protein GBAR_LOCUS23056 [Geodia barretti]|uniref:Uncharacterized protein n=1 Tax=Geodia barretti TaxID=519541 RepID=A0AA35X6J9_GEOBA|nr:hypothetical protein GBAR_LOCUS23056 [Geodia barretti]
MATSHQRTDTQPILYLRGLSYFTLRQGWTRAHHFVTLPPTLLSMLIEFL